MHRTAVAAAMSAALLVATSPAAHARRGIAGLIEDFQENPVRSSLIVGAVILVVIGWAVWKKRREAGD